MLRLPSSRPKVVQHSSPYTFSEKVGRVITTILRKITFINNWLSYLGSGHPIWLRGICGCLHSLRGVTTLLIHLLCLTKSSPCFCCISRRVSESIRCLPMDHLPEPASFYRKPSFSLSLSLRTSH